MNATNVFTIVIFEVIRKEWFCKYLKIQLDIDQKIILWSHRNNYVERVDDNVAKSFNILTTSLNVLHNYFSIKIQTKLFLDSYLTNFLFFIF